MEKISGDVIARLRASQEQYETACFKRGHENGTKWAREIAEAEHLIRLQHLWREHEENWHCCFFEEDQAGDSVGLASEILGLALRGRDEVARFWERASGHNWEQKVRSATFRYAFADGALEVWAAVQRAA